MLIAASGDNRDRYKFDPIFIYDIGFVAKPEAIQSTLKEAKSDS